MSPRPNVVIALYDKSRILAKSYKEKVNSFQLKDTNCELNPPKAI